MKRVLWLTLLIAAAPASAADFLDDINGGMGWARGAAVSGMYTTGERNGVAGTGYVARFEMVAFTHRTVFGNPSGYEFVMDLGYESFGESDDFTQGPMAMDFALGFPLTLLELGSGGMGSTRIGIAPGVGMGIQQAYAYAKGRVGMMLIPNFLDVELTYQWHPFEASLDWSEDAGLDRSTLRAAGFISVGEEYSMIAFIERVEADRKTFAAGHPDDGAIYASADPLEAFESAPFEALYRVGVGLVF